MFNRVKMGSVLKRVNAAAACLALLSLCLPAYSQVVADVATAEELRLALAGGNKHIRITDHIDGTNAQPSFTWNDGSAALFMLDPATASITGACTTQPAFDLAADWKPGMCLIHIPNISVGFAMTIPGSILWMDNLYLYLTGDVPAEQTREGIYIDLDPTGASIYLTNISTEIFPDHLPGTSASGTGLFASGSATADPFAFLLAGCSTVTNHVNINASDTNTTGSVTYFAGYSEAPLPETATVNLINSNWNNIGSARPWFIWFETDMRVEDCTFTTNVELGLGEFLFYGGKDPVTRYLYAGGTDAGIFSYNSTEFGGYKIEILDLSASTAAARAAQGFPAFLTLEDQQLLALQTEIEGAPLVPAPAAAPGLSFNPIPAPGPKAASSPVPAPAAAFSPGGATPIDPSAQAPESALVETGLAAATTSGVATLVVVAAALAAAL